jgi:ubiquitin-protein ligase
MANSGPLSRLWSAFDKLTLWSETAGSGKNKFHILSSSFDNPATTPSSELNHGGVASNLQQIWIEIIGLIYPQTEPFRERGLKLEIRVSNAFPQKPPEVYMRTANIRHPNIDRNGE